MGNSAVYLTRIVPVLSLVGVSFLLLVSFIIAPYGKTARGLDHGESTVPQLLLGAYIAFLHVLSVLFPARVCWAMGHLIEKIKDNADLTKWPKKKRTQLVKTDKGTVTYPSPVFVIILPSYKEEMGTMEETLRVLASHVHAKSSYHIYLAMEEKEQGSESKAIHLIDTFSKSFYRISYTIHPSTIPGEAQGKSSNESWAATQAFKDYPATLKKDVVVTVMDADTHLSQRYFAQVAKHHLELPETNQETIYVPPIVFDRNLDQVPLPVRTADLMWAGAGISNLYPGSAISIPTSVYSLPMTLIERVGGWDTDPGAIGEDMHMYLKCFFALSGNLKVKVIYAAASQCNVSSDKEGLDGYLDGLQARYKQALRHMWGTLDTGYALRQTFKMSKAHYNASFSPKQTAWTLTDLALYARDVLLMGMSTVCTANSSSFHTSFGLPKATIMKPSTADRSSLRPIHKLNVCTVFLRLFEAHFLPLHLSMILAISGIYENFSGQVFPREFAIALEFCAYCRWIGWILVVCFFYRYEKYLQLCVTLRKEEMRNAGLLSEDNEDDGFCHKVFHWFGLLEAGVFPLGGFVFGAFPACQAILSHLFTERLTYHVSLKPQLNVRKWQEKVKPAPLIKVRPATPQKCPSDALRKQALSQMDQVAAAMRYRAVKSED